MLEHSYDVAVISPQCLLGYVPRSQELGILPEDANQRDINESRSLMEEAYERAIESARRKYGVDARLEFHRFIPDEVAESGMGGPVQGIWEFVRLVVDSGVPVDVLTNLIADALAESAGELILIGRARESDQRAPSRRYTLDGISAYCEQHAERINPGLQASQSQVLKKPSKTSMSDDPIVVTVGLGEKELTYTISPDGEPLSIVETTQSEIRSLSTDEWREWYLTS